MKEFIKYDWSLFDKIDFGYCSITDADWELFVRECGSYKKLKIVYLGTFYSILDGNFIRTVTEKDLKAFPSLE